MILSSDIETGAVAYGYEVGDGEERGWKKPSKYDIGVDAVPYPRPDSFKIGGVQFNRIQFPTFNLSAHPEIQLSDIKQRRYDLITMAKMHELAEG